MSTNRLFSILFLCCLSVTLFAQKDKSAEIKATFWGNTSTDYKNAKAPEKWSDESAIILYQKIGYEYAKAMGRKLKASSYYHSRVILQDKAAVKEFSEFSFSETFSGSVRYQKLKGKSTVGFKIIKPDGTETEVDLTTAVEVDAGSKRDQVKKIAIPDLQEGDILDYFYQIDERFNFDVIHVFEPAINPLNQSYPVVYQELEFNVENNFYIYFQSLNGAPELENKSNDPRRIYQLVIRDMDKNENKNWYYPYRSAPTIKFQVIYSKTPYFISYLTPQDDQQPKTSLDKDEVITIYKSNSNTKEYYKGLKKHLKSKGLADQKTEAALKEAYHYLYHQIIGSKLEQLYLGVANLNGNIGRMVLNELTYFCDKARLNREWLVTVPREYSDLESVLLFGELTTILAVNVEDKDEPIYFTNPGLHPHYNEIPGEYEGAKAYNVVSSMTETLPISDYMKNHTHSLTKVQFKADDLMTLEIKSDYKHQGRNRSWVQSQLLNPYDFQPKEAQYFDDKMYLEATHKSKGSAAAQQKVDNLQNQLAERREETLKYLIEDDFKAEITNIRDFEVPQTGRLFEDTLAYSYRFDSKGLVSKAGPNYILQAGHFIGSQVEISEKGMTRTADIYMPYARSFNEDVVITIPEGYTVQGLENLNKRVINKTGGFISEATLEGNQLKINTQKWYKNNFEPAEHWELMLEFLEAAYQFTQEKVLLKKG